MDIVCFVKDYRGEKFDVRNYTNEVRYFISEKTYQGKEIKALEHPGLWSGTMDNWNTLFGDGYRDVISVKQRVRSRSVY